MEDAAPVSGTFRAFGCTGSKLSGRAGLHVQGTLLIVGSLMYAVVFTRPDIAQAVGVVSRFMKN